MCEPVTISVPIGESAQDYQAGNLLNAIDEVVCYFLQKSSLSPEHVAKLLKVYAESLEGV